MGTEREQPEVESAVDLEGTAATLIRPTPTPAPMPMVAVELAASVQLPSQPGVVVRNLDGEDLSTHLAYLGTLTGEEAAQLGVPLCNALAQLRAHGVTFRALTPSQIFLAGGLPGFSPKLVGEGNTDFPLERCDQVPAGADVAAIALLLAGAVAGRPIANAEELSAATEVPPWLHDVLARCVGEVAGQERLVEAGALADALKPFARAPIPLIAEAPVPRAPRAEAEGDVLGNYQLGRKLGEGSMGQVFLARHVTLGRTVALKVLRPEHARDDALVQRFFQEAKAVNQINHEHIVEIRDFVHDAGPGGSGRVYCVMELLEGQSVAELLRAGPVPIQRTARIVRQVCAALAAAHQVGVIHRDVKPDNLFLTERHGDPDYVKVLDFGVAKVGGPLGEGPISGTLAGTVLGTPMYMAPEQASGLAVDGRTDLYALATVLYELLAGQPPFRAPTVGQMVVQVITEAPPPLPQRTPGGERIPNTLRNLVMRCLEKDPARRPRTMVELSALLLPYELGRKVPLAPWRPIGVAVGATLAATALLWAAWPDGSREAPPAEAVARPVASAPASPRAWVEPRPAPAPEVRRAELADAEGSSTVTPLVRAPKPQAVGPGRSGLVGAAPARVTGVQSAKGTARAAPKKRKLSRDAVVDPFSL